MYFYSYFNTSLSIISSYKGEMPLHHFLKKYFLLNKKYGSKDRKWISHFVYCFYRLGKSLNHLKDSERLKAALYLCNDNVDLKVLFEENWIDHIDKELHNRIDFLKSIYPEFLVEEIFPYENKLSETIDGTVFSENFLYQPKLFIRTRKSQLPVLEKLKTAGIEFEKISDTCLAFNNSTKLESILKINDEVVIQDASSQNVAEFFSLISFNKDQPQVWDCCAASGGKSIMAIDYFPNIQLTVSDIRSSILQNLKKRFHEAGIKNYQSFITDLSHKNNSESKYNLIFCDAPCTGSGTWSRTPEQLYFFDKNKIDDYADLQKKIIENTITALAEGGYYLYITCSVFKKENEEIADMIEKKFSLKLISKKIIKGYKNRADTMFAALFERNK